MKDVGDTIAWLIGSAASASTSGALLEELASRLLAEGLPLDRIAVSVSVLHPDIANLRFIWRRGQSVQTVERGYEAADSESDPDGPVLFEVRSSGKVLRCRLNRSPLVEETPFFRKLAAEGFTDFLAVPLHFSTGQIQIVSWATQMPAGFSEEDQALLLSLAAPLSRVAEIRSLLRMTTTFLQTYIGRQTAERILAGHVRRGDTESIHAAIWLSDMRGFTSLADRLAPSVLLALLNRYFDCQVPAIEAGGGEVLKFMGDGLLAIFPVGEGGSAKVCRAALAAAREARAQIYTLERELVEEHAADRPFSLALHVGEVLYGNIGGGSRLDFTVIGAAVNLAQRLERLARDLRRSVIASEVFAVDCGEPLVSLGSYALRGLSAPQLAFGLPEEQETNPASETEIIGQAESSAGAPARRKKT
jgi:adenylate cyclase